MTSKHEINQALWARGIKVPVTEPEDLDALDDDEIVAGYFAARNGSPDDPEPGNNHTRAFWHGWRNGMADRGYRESDSAMAELARKVVARGDFARMFGVEPGVNSAGEG